jgi:hypothetical protein
MINSLASSWKVNADEIKNAVFNLTRENIFGDLRDFER